MIPRRLRPVGEAAPSFIQHDELLNSSISALPTSTRWFSSGTEALAVACICAAAQLRKHFPDIDHPEFILPAYTCPDVVSAVLYSGGRPVLCDLEENSCRLDIGELDRLIGRKTAAVIAVNFQGIPERIKAIRSAIGENRAKLIYDHCQDFPGAASNEKLVDYTVFSFGRGKPASALEGGALIEKIDDTSIFDNIQIAKPARPKSTLAIFAYNILISPKRYLLAESVPFLSIGKTTYRHLDSIRGLSMIARSRIYSAMNSYEARDAKILDILRLYRETIEPRFDLALLCGVEKSKRLLRLVLLMPDRKCRDSTLNQLKKANLGSTELYKKPLTDIPNIPRRLESGIPAPRAMNFADRILTMPVHSDVLPEDIKKMGDILRQSV